MWVMISYTKLDEEWGQVSEWNGFYSKPNLEL
jgi:hypothetical protein